MIRSVDNYTNLLWLANEESSQELDDIQPIERLSDAGAFKFRCTCHFLGFLDNYEACFSTNIV